MFSDDRKLLRCRNADTVDAGAWNAMLIKLQGFGTFDDEIGSALR